MYNDIMIIIKIEIERKNNKHVYWNFAKNMRRFVFCSFRFNTINTKFIFTTMCRNANSSRDSLYFISSRIESIERSCRGERADGMLTDMKEYFDIHTSRRLDKIEKSNKLQTASITETDRHQYWIRSSCFY